MEDIHGSKVLKVLNYSEAVFMPAEETIHDNHCNHPDSQTLSVKMLDIFNTMRVLLQELQDIKKQFWEVRTGKCKHANMR